MARHLTHAVVDGQVVVACSDYQVGPARSPAPVICAGGWGPVSRSDGARLLKAVVPRESRRRDGPRAVLRIVGNPGH
jgi:hypothetical protein